jgi:hypothetical protein
VSAFVFIFLQISPRRNSTQNEKVIKREIVEARVPHRDCGLSPPAGAFVGGLLHPDWQQRLGTVGGESAVQAAPFFKPVSWDVARRGGLPPALGTFRHYPWAAGTSSSGSSGSSGGKGGGSDSGGGCDGGCGGGYNGRRKYGRGGNGGSGRGGRGSGGAQPFDPAECAAVLEKYLAGAAGDGTAATAAAVAAKAAAVDGLAEFEGKPDPFGSLQLRWVAEAPPMARLPEQGNPRSQGNHVGQGNHGSGGGQDVRGGGSDGSGLGDELSGGCWGGGGTTSTWFSLRETTETERADVDAKSPRGEPSPHFWTSPVPLVLPLSPAAAAAGTAPAEAAPADASRAKAAASASAFAATKATAASRLAKRWCAAHESPKDPAGARTGEGGGRLPLLRGTLPGGIYATPLPPLGRTALLLAASGAS